MSTRNPTPAIGITTYLPGVDDPAVKYTLAIVRAGHRRSSLTPSQRRGIAAMQQARNGADVEADAAVRRAKVAALRPGAVLRPSQRPIASLPTTHVSSLSLSTATPRPKLKPMPQPPTVDPVVIAGNWPPQYLGLFMLLIAIVAVGGVFVGAKMARQAEWTTPTTVIDEGGVDAAVEPAPAGWR